MRTMMQARRLLMAGVCALAAGAGAAERSAEQIVSERCQNCHGIAGQSSSPLYPKLAAQNAEYLQRQLLNFKLGRRDSEEMNRQVADLTGGELAALADYFSKKPLIPDIAFDPALAEIGRYLYLNGNKESGVTACAACHGPDAHGALFLPRLAGQHASYLERQLKAFVEHARSSQEMVMHSVVSAITDFEIKAVAQYLSGQE